MRQAGEACLDGGWDFIQADTDPFYVQMPLLVELETGGVPPGTWLALKFVVRNPRGFQVHEQLEEILVLDSLVRRSKIIVNLKFSGSESGRWRIQILAERDVVKEYAIEVRLPRQNQVDEQLL